MSEPWTLTLAELAAALAARELSAAELLDSELRRLAEVEPHLQAWASVDADGARAAAISADSERAAGRGRGPLHGIPVGIKDVIDTAGWPTEAGSELLRGNIPTRDAAAVARLRDAGAVVLGKTVTHEFACGQNQPPTRNPWDPARYAGGSSIGSGVAVATGTAVAALGTDTTGSIRNPAAVNGIVGLKPTNGLISARGVIPVSPTLDQVGPLTRTVTDCALMLQALVGPGRTDESSGVPNDYTAALDRPLSHIRIGIDPRWWSGCGVQPAAEDAVRRALAALEKVGVDVMEVRIPALELALPAGLTVALCETARAHRHLLRERSLDYAPGTRVMLAMGVLISDSDELVARRVSEMVRRDVLAAFAQNGLTLLASPALPDVAPLLTEMTNDFTDAPDQPGALAGALGLLSVANVCALPSISVPCGTSAGLPLGLQLIGRPLAEPTLLRVARAYERSAEWHPRRPPAAAAGAGGYAAATAAIAPSRTTT